uniref:Uncharacterized protein n=1 Tax=Rhizophora mucronata TaxID=61149 RepID=A0A2P2IVA5_RHIMU
MHSITWQHCGRKSTKLAIYITWCGIDC